MNVYLEICRSVRDPAYVFHTSCQINFQKISGLGVQNLHNHLTNRAFYIHSPPSSITILFYVTRATQCPRYLFLTGGIFCVCQKTPKAHLLCVLSGVFLCFVESLSFSFFFFYADSCFVYCIFW